MEPTFQNMNPLDLSKIPDGAYYVSDSGRTNFSDVLHPDTYSFTGKKVSSPTPLRLNYTQLAPISDINKSGFKYHDPKTGELLGSVRFDLPHTITGLVLIVEKESVKILMPQISHDDIIEYTKRQNSQK